MVCLDYKVEQFNRPKQIVSEHWYQKPRKAGTESSVKRTVALPVDGLISHLHEVVFI